MSTLVVGDVHACADELADLIAQARPTRLILVGDVFNKGPKPDETWDLVRHHGAEAVLGNHDVVVIDAFDRGEVLAPAPAVAWLRSLPLTISGIHPRPWTVVHGGIDPERGVSGTSRAQAINMRRWPDDGEPSNPFWWERWAGPPLVLYGHDATRGLVDHRPHSIGLDTGCVYGGRLTGFIIEEDEIVSVPARSAYRPIV